jgi:hypothetical protein
MKSIKNKIRDPSFVSIPELSHIIHLSEIPRGTVWGLFNNSGLSTTTFREPMKDLIINRHLK